MFNMIENSCILYVHTRESKLFLSKDNKAYLGVVLFYLILPTTFSTTFSIIVIFIPTPLFRATV